MILKIVIFPKTYQGQAAKKIQVHFITLKLKHKTILKYQFFFFQNIPFLASDPPTIRFCGTFENPHPSSGVSKRPLIFCNAGISKGFGGLAEKY